MYGRTPLHNATFGSFVNPSEEKEAIRRDIIQELIRNGASISVNQKIMLVRPLYISQQLEANLN